jgi:hypothetical protein
MQDASEPQTHADLRVYSSLSKALWSDADISERVSIDALVAASLASDSAPDARIGRAVQAMLERANREGRAATTRNNLAVIHEPFFRLSPEERILLVGLHLGHWSYARLARILQVSEEKIEEMAWVARSRLSNGVYPSGPGQLGTNCPEYDALRPWTQRFLDDEVSSSRERIFLQNHLMACEGCRQALSRFKELYFQVEKELSQHVSVSANEEDRFLFDWLKPAVDRSFGESLRIFVRRRDVQIALAVLIGVIMKSLF